MKSCSIRSRAQGRLRFARRSVPAAPGTGFRRPATGPCGWSTDRPRSARPHQKCLSAQCPDGLGTGRTWCRTTGQESLATFLSRITRPSEAAKRLKILIFDQFEELFTTYPERWKDRKQFLIDVAAALTLIAAWSRAGDSGKSMLAVSGLQRRLFRQLAAVVPARSPA